MRHFSLIRLLAFATPSESFQQSSTHVALQSAAQQHHATPRVTRKLTSAVKSHSIRVEEEQDDTSRRRALGSLFAGGSLAFLGASRSNALDMDAFINSEVRVP